MIIAIDIDDVILDFVPAWLEAYNKEYKDKLKIKDIIQWDISKLVVPECGENIYKYLDDPNIYDSVKIIDGACESIKILKNLGHRILYVTSRHHPGKYALLKNVNLLDIGDYIVLEDKKLIRANVLIDDKFETVKEFYGLGILFLRPWNKFENWPNTKTASTWHDIINIIEKESKINALINGVSSDVKIAINSVGVKQPALSYRFDLIDPFTIFRLAHILSEGAQKYGEWNWRGLTIQDNINHAIIHLYAFLAGDEQDDHLGHAFCRTMFALSLKLRPE